MQICAVALLFWGVSWALHALVPSSTPEDSPWRVAADIAALATTIAVSGYGIARSRRRQRHELHPSRWFLW